MRLERGVVIATASGKLGLAQAKEGALAAWNAHDLDGKPIVWDLRAAELDFEPDEVRQLALFILGRQPAPPSRVAIVTGRDVDFGLARMLEVYRDHPATQVHTFRDYDEAVSWATPPGNR
jgi:hypothetical protein